MIYVWYILISYIIFSISSVISVIYYKNSRKRKDKRQLLLANEWKKYIGYVIDAKAIKNLKMDKKNYGKLYSGEQLMAFFTASQEYLYSEQPEVKNRFRQFIRQNKQVWVKIGHTYKKRELIKKAYFSFLCEQFYINEPEEYDSMTELMLDYVISPSIYCRENALKALYAFGNKDAVIEVFKKLSDSNIQHNNKLVTDGLLQFRGSKEELALGLYNDFDKFSLEYQVAFIDFFRFAGEELKYELKELLIKKDANKELVCSLLRYYKKYPVQEYKHIILSWLNPAITDDWECISSAASALGKYQGEDTVNALKSALSSKYWYVRLNAAQSLSELDIGNDMLLDVLNGDDRYAKEQLVYQLNRIKG